MGTLLTTKPGVAPTAPKTGAQKVVEVAKLALDPTAIPRRITGGVIDKLGDAVPAIGVTKEGIRNTVRGVTVDNAISMVDKARSGELDEFFGFTGRTALEKADLHKELMSDGNLTIGSQPTRTFSDTKGFFKTIGDGLFGTKNNIMGETHLGKMADEFTRGTNSDPNSLTQRTYKALGIADDPKLQEKIGEWSQADPLTGNLISSVLNWGKLALANTEVISSAAVPGAGVLHIVDVVKEGWLQETEAEFLKRGYKWDPEEYSTEALMSGIVQGSAEKAAAGVSLAAIAGKSMIGRLVMGGAQTTSKVAAVAGVGASHIGAHTVEAGTENVQSRTASFFTNQVLKDYAARNGIEYDPISDEEITERANQAAEVGFFASAGMQAAAFPVQVRQVYSSAKMAQVQKKAGSELTETELGNVVHTYQQTARRYGEEALAETDIKLEAMLEAESTDSLLSMAQTLGLPVRTGSRQELKDLLTTNKTRLPEYQEAALEQVIKDIGESDRGSLEKHVYKWMAQGDIRPEQMIQFRTVMEAAIENSDYDGTLEEYFEEHFKLEKGQPVMELNQAEGWHGGRGVNGKPFGNFDLTYSGTGEGAAAFGHGVYLTERFGIGKGYATAINDKSLPKARARFGGTYNRDVARVYRHLSGMRFDGRPSPESVYDYLIAELSTSVKEKERKLRIGGMSSFRKTLVTESLEIDKRKLEEFEAGGLEALDVSAKPESFVYKVTLFPGQEEHEYNLLSWYEAIPRELEDKIFAAFPDIMLDEEIVLPEDPNRPPVFRGDVVYRALTSKLGSKKAASDFLQENGMDGIVFPAESLSTGTKTPEKGNRNFVIFNEENVRIEEAKAYEQGLELFQKGDRKPPPAAVKSGHTIPVYHQTRATFDIFDKDRAMGATRFDPLDPNIFHQKGRKLPNSQVVRGKTSFLTEGKMMLDLFATGDLLTLSHEFAHALSPYMTEDMSKAIIASTVRQYYPTASGETKTAQLAEHTTLWNRFQGDPSQTFSEQEVAKLRRMQELLAEGFEVYLSTGKAPNHRFTTVFKIMRDRMLEYYEKVGEAPMEYRQVDKQLAESFDKLLAGDHAVPRSEISKIRLKDDEGKTKIYILERSRPHIKAHALLLKYLNRHSSHKTGKHAAVRKYAVAMLGEIPKVMDLEIGNLETREQALRYMNKIDVTLAKQQALAKKEKISDLKKIIKKIKKLDLLDNTKESLDYILKDLDMRSKTLKRIRSTYGLDKALKNFRNAVELIPEELRSTTPEELADIDEMRKRSPGSLSMDEIDYTIKAIKDLIEFNFDKIEKARDEYIAEQGKLNSKGKAEAKTNWRSKRDRSNRVKNPFVGYGRAKAASMTRAIIMLDSLGDGNDNSFWTKITGDLRRGRSRQNDLDTQFTDFTRDLFTRMGLREHGVSKAIGRVGSKQMHATQVGGQTVELATGQLMMFYGYMRNKRAKRVLLRNGFKLKDNKIKTYKFSSESEIYTAISALSKEEMQAVDEMMDYYENTVYPIINAVYKRMNFGISLKKEDFYLPLFISWENRGNAEFLTIENRKVGEKGFDNLNSLMESKGDWLKRHVKSMEFLNIRKGGSQPLYAVDFTEGVDSNLTNVAFYGGMAEPITQARSQLLGAKGIDGSIHSSLLKMFGQEQVKGIETWLDRIEQNGFISDDDWSRYVEKANSLSRRGILAGSVSIAALQPVSARMAVNHGISEKDFNKAALTDLVSGYNVRDLIKRSSMLRLRYETLAHITGAGDGLKYRTRSRWITPKSLTSQVMDAKSVSGVKDVVKNMHLGPLAMISRSDARALSIILRALESKYASELESGDMTDAALMEEFDRIVASSQPTNDPMYVSKFQSDPSAWLKMTYGAFRTARDAVMGDAQRSFMGFMNARNGQSAETQKRWAWRFMNTMVVGQAIVAAVQDLAYQIKKDDDDEWDDNFLLSWGARMVTNTISLIPFEGAILSSVINAKIRGWGDVSGGEMPLVSNLAQLYREMTDSDDMGKKTLDIMGASARLLGSAFGNAERDLSKVIPEGGDGI